jgi:hypothetical protein
MAQRSKSAAAKLRQKAKSNVSKISAPSVLADILPLPERKFQGRIGTYYTNSEAEVPAMASAPVGAPNVLLVLRYVKR